MKNVSRITYVITLTVFFVTCASTVSANKTDWIDKNYKFSNIQRVYLCKVDTSSFKVLDELTAEKIQNTYKNFAGKLKDVVFAEDEKSADVKIIPTINVWENSSRFVPERVEVYYEGYEERRVKVSEGEWKRERGHYKTSHTYFPGANRKEKRFPAHWDYDSELKVSFEVYDTASGKLILSRIDTRSRGTADSQPKMFERICKSFFKDFNKKLL